MSEMLPYLVDELRLDVNALVVRWDAVPSAGHYGTPLTYAAYKSDNAVAVIKWLLSNGADPRCGDADAVADATGMAQASEHQGSLAVMMEWKGSNARA